MFTPIKMGTNHMLGIDNYTPLTTNNFEIRIYNMDGTAPTEFSDLLTLSTDEVGSIQEEQDTIVVHYGNGLIKFPSKVTFGDVDWTLNCYCEPNVLDALRAWRKQVYDPDTERMGLPSEYMKQVFFIKYDGQGNVRDVIRCPGTWIGALDNGSMSQAGGDIVKVKVPFIISRAIYMKPEDFQ
nr:MAG TPA: baseplate wedge protein [Caudoviricetes sp.]